MVGGDVPITVVDPFIASVEIQDSQMHGAFDTFMANMHAIDARDKVRMLRGRSADHLPKLIVAGEQFDIILIDGRMSHLM